MMGNLSRIDVEAPLNDEWFFAFRGCFRTVYDVIDFIINSIDISDWEDSCIDLGGYNEPNETIKITPEDKKDVLYDFIMDLATNPNFNRQ